MNRYGTMINSIRGQQVRCDTHFSLQLLGLGVSRHTPQVNLVARLLTYDPAGDIVRRYRRLRVNIIFARPAQAGGLAALSKVSQNDNPHLDVTESVLAAGVVYKIPVTLDGVYRIDRQFLSDLPGLNLSPDDIDPDDVKVYGNGGRPLPALNGAPRPADLLENPAYRSDGGEIDYEVRVTIRSNPRAAVYFESGSERLMEERARFTTTLDEDSPVAASGIARRMAVIR